MSGFPGAVIESSTNERGGNPVYYPGEKHLPQLLAFWEPVAAFARDHGVRIAFEHCPQGAYHLPVMHYNTFGQPAMWEKFFNATRCENIGLEWDPSHLICQFIDPVANLKQFGSRCFTFTPRMPASTARCSRNMASATPAWRSIVSRVG